MATVNRLSRRYDQTFIEKLIYMPTLTKELLDNQQTVTDWMDEMTSRLNVDQGLSNRYSLERSDQDGKPTFNIIKRTHGIEHPSSICEEFFSGSDYKKLRALGQQLDGLLAEDAYVQRGERTKPVESFKQALDWLMEEAKRGQHIQRYKGLGEMNPEQLWETTMDPNTRRLLQVTIEDVIAADEIFTTLMGDQVEPRREFIESNALTVENLDV